MPIGRSRRYPPRAIFQLPRAGAVFPADLPVPSPEGSASLTLDMSDSAVSVRTCNGSRSSTTPSSRPLGPVHPLPALLANAARGATDAELFRNPRNRGRPRRHADFLILDRTSTSSRISSVSASIAGTDVVLAIADHVGGSEQAVKATNTS